MKIDVITQDKEKVNNIELSSSIFEAPINEHLVHEVVTSYFSNSRAGTKGQKNRSTAKGGGSKPWRQKGTGRARAGTIRSPLWVGGGRAFSSSDSNYSKKINRKVFKYASEETVEPAVDKTKPEDVVKEEDPKKKK